MGLVALVGQEGRWSVFQWIIGCRKLSEHIGFAYCTMYSLKHIVEKMLDVTIVTSDLLLLRWYSDGNHGR